MISLHELPKISLRRTFKILPCSAGHVENVGHVVVGHVDPTCMVKNVLLLIIVEAPVDYC